MPARRFIFVNVKPITGYSVAAIAGIVLVGAIAFTWSDLPWVAFLSGIFVAAIIALVNRLANAELALAAARDQVRQFDAELPIMVAHVSAKEKLLFHNHAFRNWLRARREAIDGKSLQDVVGVTTYAQLRAGVEAALAGKVVHGERVESGRDGDLRFYVQYLPQSEGSGSAGAVIIQTDITSLETLSPPQPEGRPRDDSSGSLPPEAQPVTPLQAIPGEQDAPERRIFVNTIAEGFTDWSNSGDRLRAALNNDEFCLYFQLIAPVDAEKSHAPLREVLLRLREEEEGLMPPGAFLPLAEECGLLPDLDRWVVVNALDWACARPERRSTILCINVSAATLGQEGFAEFVIGELVRKGAKGAQLCFEVLESDVTERFQESVRMVSKLAEAGCATTLCGFGRNAASYTLLKHLKVDYLKIDGDIILGLARNPVDLIKLKAITRVARLTNRRTIAEFVEGEETLSRLREFGVDYAQGFGISQPAPLADLDPMLSPAQEPA